MEGMACARILLPLFAFLSSFQLSHCHFFSMTSLRELIPHSRISHLVLKKTEAASVVACNLGCINEKACVSTLFTISKNKCVLLKNFFDEVKEYGETAKQDKTTKIIESRLVDSPLPAKNKKKLKKDDKVKGFSCLDIKRQNANSTSDFYDIWLNSSKSSTIKVYCDMKSDKGGWTQVLYVKSETNNMADFLKLPFNKWAALNGFNASGNYMMMPTVLHNSSLFSAHPQIRFKCKLSGGKNLNIATANNSAGRAVVDWLTGGSNDRPNACNTFSALRSDNSYLSQHCSDWGKGKDVEGVGKWGRDGFLPANDRFTDHPMFIWGKTHWNVFSDHVSPKRFECENQHRSQQIGKGDTWKIFVR